jgi:hypothetical protein
LKKGKTEGQLKEFFAQINHELCDPDPLPEHEINAIWQSATEFVRNIIENGEEKGPESGPPSIIEEASRAIYNEQA